MICGTCKTPMRTVRRWRNHKAKTGCNWHRDVWAKVLKAKRRGASGNRLLSAAYPHLYKRGKPMTEETKARLRELDAKRVKVDMRRVKARRKGKVAS